MFGDSELSLLQSLYLTQCKPLCPTDCQGIHQPGGGVRVGGDQARHSEPSDQAWPGDVHQAPAPGHRHHRQARPDLPGDIGQWRVSETMTSSTWLWWPGRDSGCAAGGAVWTSWACPPAPAPWCPGCRAAPAPALCWRGRPGAACCRWRDSGRRCCSWVTATWSSHVTHHTSQHVSPHLTGCSRGRLMLLLCPVWGAGGGACLQTLTTLSWPRLTRSSPRGLVARYTTPPRWPYSRYLTCGTSYKVSCHYNSIFR